MAEPDEPDDFGEDDEVLTECPYCDGDGWRTDGEFSMECPECGGDGWF